MGQGLQSHGCGNRGGAESGEEGSQSAVVLHEVRERES